MAADFAQFNAAFPWFFPVAAAVFGACIGSFLNVVILRLPREESIVTPGSRCVCGAPIRWHDNIPVLSWLLLHGRARCCGQPFSFRYPFVELLTAESALADARYTLVLSKADLLITAARIAFALLAVMVLWVCVLHWRGFV